MYHAYFLRTGNGCLSDSFCLSKPYARIGIPRPTGRLLLSLPLTTWWGASRSEANAHIRVPGLWSNGRRLLYVPVSCVGISCPRLYASLRDVVWLWRRLRWLGGVVMLLWRWVLLLLLLLIDR